MTSNSRRPAVISHGYLHSQQDDRDAEAAAKNMRHEKQHAIPQVVQRRVVPGCEPIFCWGLHAGREWVIAASNAGQLSVLCSGAAGASSQSKSFSLWQTIDLRRHRDHFHRHRNGGGSPSPDAPGDGADAGAGAGASAGAQESDAGTDNDASEWNITALAWCKPPSAKLGSHPLDPDASYCAAFAVGSFGRVSIFNPTERNVLEWELISVLEPAGAVQCLTWASEGRHLVSGGTQLVLWSPEANAIGPSGASSIAGSVHSGGSAAFTSANTDRNHARLLASRSPAATNGTLSPSGATLGEDDVRSEPFTRRRNHVTSESELRAASEHGGDFSPRDEDDLPGYEFPRQSMDGANSLDSEDERIAAFDASWVLEEAEGQITLVDFSADSRMFASVSEHSLEVRVWFEGDSLFGNMDYLSLFHPREILALQWRARSDGHSYHVKAQHSHTPQSLVTLCADHIVRIWQESDPQTEELAMFVAIHIDTRHRPLRSIGWLKFINYFEGLRSPFPEHNMYAQVREDFVVGFSSASPFFQSHAHQTTVWGDHQKQSVELRTGPIAQESQSSLDWLVAVDQAGQVCMWSLEGLSDSPRRDIHISPWNKSCSKIFSHVELGSNSNPLVLRRPDDVYLTRHVCGQSDEELLHYESREDFFDEAATRRSAPTNWAAHVYNSFVATCRVTQEFDPHTERDPWPSTCVFDINPRNIETLSFGESGLVYSFAENDTMKMNSAYGTVTHMTLCLARGHTTEITEIVYERVIDLASNYSSLEEAYWVTTIDRSGFAVAWPVRSGSREEDIDADAIVRSGAVPLPMEGNISRAIVSEIAEHHMICLIIDNNGRAHLWLRLGIAAYSWSEAAVPDALQTAIGALSGEPARYVFAVRDGRYKVHFGIHTASNDLVIVPVTEIMRAVPGIEVGEARVRQFSSGASPLCVAPVSDKQLFGHGALALVALENGKCELQGFAEEGPIETFVLIPDDPATSIANASSGGIVTVHESGLVRVWAPGLCHLSHGLQSTICVQDDVAGRCTVETASALYLGAGVSVLGIGIHEATENGQSAAAKVLLYSRARSGFSLVARDQAVEFKLLGSTRAALRRAKLVGIAWSGRDFGLIAATSNQLHLFQGWVRHPPVGDMAKELNMLRRRMQLEGKGVSSSRTEQLEALNGLGDAAVALQLPMALHRPRPILELLRAGCVSPVRAILKTILAALEEKKQENEDAYGQDEAPPRSAMFVSAPDIELHEIVREIWNDAENEMAPSTTDHEDAASQDAAQSQDDTSGGKDTAAALFADDDWSMGGSSTQRTTGGAAAALFDEDPWDSMLTSSAAQTTLSDPTQDVERSRSELAELLVSYTIKDMPPLEQLQLTALAGVFDDVYGMNDADKGGFGDSVDKCGAKFMLAYQLFRVSKRVLPLSERPRAMPTADLLWALDSDSQDALLAKCLPPGESTWDDAKEIGVGLWLRSTHAVRVLAEDLAKVQFKESKTKDPFSCALFYFALNKASVVSGLFKLAKNTKAAELLANDFSDEHWQTVAVKNAYSLLRKKKYLEAASFFVLGKRLAEAVNVCIKNLGDFQLAVFVCKLVEGADGEVQRTVWEYTIKPLALYTMDHWLASMCHTVAGDPVGALLAFVEDREAFLAEQQQHGETKVGGAVPGDASESAILGTTSADEEGFRVFDDLPTLLRKGLVNRELLEKLSNAPYPGLTRSFNSLEPSYIRTLIQAGSKQSALAPLVQSRAAHRVLHDSMARAASHAASTGIPLLSLLTLQTIESGLCRSCIEQTRLRLAAQVLHPLLLKAHASTGAGSGGADTKGDDARESSTSRMVPSPDRVSKLRQDLHAVNEQLARCPPQDILESLWRISRASNHLAVEFTVIRMLSDVNQPAFLIRLQQLLHSVMDSFVALGHGNATLGVAAERTLLPGRRLAAYAVLLVDLAAAAHEIFHAAPVIPGLDKLHLPPALTARKPRDDIADDSNGNNGVNNGSGDAGNGAGQEPESADEEISEIAQQYREMLDAYARVALFAAAYSMGQHGLVQALLDESFAPSAIRQTGLELANTWFDYEELLMFAASAQHRQGKNFRDDLTALSGTVGEDEVESEEEDMVAWGLTYAERLMNVAVMRSVLTLVTRVRDKLYLMQGQPPQLVHSPKSGSTPGSPTSPAEKALHPEVYCLELMEELVQSCWPVNWAMLANLYMSSIPVGLSSAARARLEQMKVQAFADEDKSKLWNAIKGKEQLRIVDATARWTGRSIDQEQARSGIIPDSTIFCTDNAKVVHSASGTLFLSVDPVHALDGTLVVASEKGCEVVRHSFGENDGDDDDDDDMLGTSEDEGSYPLRAHRSMQLTRSPLGVSGPDVSSSPAVPLHNRAQSQPADPLRRLRRRSMSDESLAKAKGTAHGVGSSTENSEVGSSRSAHHHHHHHHHLSMRRLSSRGVMLHASKIRRPHIRLRRSSRKRSSASERKGRNSVLQHAWSSSAKSLLMVSQDAGQIWFNDSLRIPLNNNLYCDSFLHRVSSHSRVEALLQSSRSLSSNGSSASDGGHGGSRTRLLPHVSSHHKKNEETVRTVMHVSSHPFLPLYVTAQYDGSAMIWDAARDPEEPVVRLRKPSDDARKWKHGHTTRVRISEDGMRFAACDSAGHVLLWNLADCRDSENEPFGQFACHTKRTLDCAFLNYNGNIFASAGQSQHSENLCLWDLSMPPRSCRVASVHCCAHSVAYSLAYLQDQQVVIVGGGNGQIGVFDLRQRMLILEEDHVHSKAIRSLAVHPTGGRYFASGSTDGSVKLWSYRSGRLASHAHLTNMHPTHMFVNELTSDSILSQRGTTDVTFSRDFLYSCGADGTVKMTPLSSLAL